jgi:hypothetical protein
MMYHEFSTENNFACCDLHSATTGSPTASILPNLSSDDFISTAYLFSNCQRLITRRESMRNTEGDANKGRIILYLAKTSPS